MTTGLLVASIVLLVISIAVLAVGIFIMARGVNRLSGDLSGFLEETRSELVPAIRELRQVVSEVDFLAADVKEKVQRIDGVISTVERIADGRVLATAATKALAGSKITAASVIEGVRQGLRTFRSGGQKPREERKHDTE